MRQKALVERSSKTVAFSLFYRGVTSEYAGPTRRSLRYESNLVVCVISLSHKTSVFLFCSGVLSVIAVEMAANALVIVFGPQTTLALLFASHTSIIDKGCW